MHLRKYAVSPQKHKKVYWSIMAGGWVLLSRGGREVGDPAGRRGS